MKKMKTEIGTTGKNPADYDIIIVGSPVWGWNMTPAARTYLENNKEKIKKYAFFVTSGNTPSEKIAPYFKEIMGQDSLNHTGFNAKEMKDENIRAQKIAEFVKAIK